jgi:hypothetical protein
MLLYPCLEKRNLLKPSFAVLYMREKQTSQVDLNDLEVLPPLRAVLRVRQYVSDS